MIGSLLTFAAIAQEKFKDGYIVHVAPYINGSLDITNKDSAAPAYDTTGFLRLITRGKVSLYFYRDWSDVPYYFIQRQTDAPEQLVIRTAIVDRDGHRNFQQEDVYKYQLGRYLHDCPGIALPDLSVGQGWRGRCPGRQV